MTRSSLSRQDLRPARPTRRRTGAVATAALVGALAVLGGTAGPALAADDDPLDQTVTSDEETVTGQEVIADGHVDLGPRFVDGEWTLQARDDRAVPPVWRFPEETVFWVTDDGILQAPDNPDYAFLGAEPGAPLFVIPQVQEQTVVWLGWNTQDPEVTERINRGATLTLYGVDGPAPVFLFLQEGVTGPPNVLWNSTEELPQSLWMEVNTHTHANWVFTEPGTYLLDVEVHTDLVDGADVSDRSTLLFAVGSDTDPQDALDALAARDATPEDSPDADQNGTAEGTDGDLTPDGPDNDGAPVPGDGETSDSGGGLSIVPLTIGAAGVLLAGVVAGSLLSGRARRRAAEVDEPSEPSGEAL